MAELVPLFPLEVWDGLSENTLRVSLQDNINPNSQDWDRIVTEVVSMQETVATQEDLDAFNDVTLENSDAMDPIPVGSPVYVSGASAVALAQADAAATAAVLGLAKATIAAEMEGAIVESGPLTLTTAQWDVVTGGSGGLTAGSIYYLSAATAGELTTTAPSGGGEQVVPVGIALSDVTLLIRIGYPVEISGG